MSRRLFTLVLLCSLTATAPALAQTDLSGWWARQSQNDNGYSNDPVDLIGIPVSADGRAKALSYNIAALSATERQCQMYTPWYIVFGPFPLQIIPEQDPVTQKLMAYRITGWGDKGEQMVWMDGRPRPSPNAPHTHGGFSTGTWEGNSLKVVTTHFKMGDMKRHRAISSDRATMTYTLTRHDDLLTVTGILDDPVYLAEPFVLTEIFQRSSDTSFFPLTACEPIEELPHLHENPALVPHYLPGKNPFMNEMTQKKGIPLEAVMGGPETIYPEYRKKLKDTYKAPEKCVESCGGPPRAGRGAPPPRRRPRCRSARWDGGRRRRSRARDRRPGTYIIWVTIAADSPGPRCPPEERPMFRRALGAATFVAAVLLAAGPVTGPGAGREGRKGREGRPDAPDAVGTSGPAGHLGLPHDHAARAAARVRRS